MRWGCWWGTPTAPTGDVTAYELGTRFQINGPCLLVGVRIWNPGVDARTSRTAKLYFANSSYANTGLVVSATLPDTLPAAQWSDWYWDRPQLVSGGTLYALVSYDTAASTNGDYGQILNSFVAAITTPDGVIQFPIGAGRYTDVPDTYPEGMFGNNYYSIDPLYEVGGSGRTIFDLITDVPVPAATILQRKSTQMAQLLAN